MHAEEVMEILKREHAHQVQHQDEEKYREKAREPSTSLFLAEDRLDHLVAEIDHHDFDELREAAPSHVSLITLTLATSANPTCGEEKPEDQHDAANDEHDFVQGRDVSDLADPTDLRPHRLAVDDMAKR